METLRLLISTEPVPTQHMAPHMPRNLATICDKCLRGDTARRYASAHGIREDIEHYLAGKPILARQTGLIERTWRWCKRNPSLAAALGSVAALLFWNCRRVIMVLEPLTIALQNPCGQPCGAGGLWDAYITRSQETRTAATNRLASDLPRSTR